MTVSDLTALKILYLEDEPLIAYDTTECLRELGVAQVTTAARLSQAEAASKEEDFDVAILDINVDCNQTSLALGAALSEKGTRVIFASGNSFDAEELRAKGYGFLDKPFSHGDLSLTIRGMLEPA